MIVLGEKKKLAKGFFVQFFALGLFLAWSSLLPMIKLLEESHYEELAYIHFTLQNAI